MKICKIELSTGTTYYIESTNTAKACVEALQLEKSRLSKTVTWRAQKLARSDPRMSSFLLRDTDRAHDAIEGVRRQCALKLEKEIEEIDVIRIEKLEDSYIGKAE